MSLRPSSCYCSPTIVSPIQVPTSFFKYISKSIRYFLNKIPLATPPWLTPVSDGINGLSLPPLFTLKQVLEYKSLRVSITRPLQPPFMILKNNIWRFTRSNAFEQSTKQTYYGSPIISCLCIKPRRINILSDVLRPLINPSLYLSICPIVSFTNVNLRYTTNSKSFLWSVEWLSLYNHWRYYAFQI